MWLYDETKLSYYEHLLRIPLVILAMIVGQKYLPFLLYTATGPSAAVDSLLIARFITGVCVIAAMYVSDLICPLVQHALPRIFLRAGIELASIPLSIFITLFLPVILICGILTGMALGMMKLIIAFFHKGGKKP